VGGNDAIKLDVRIIAASRFDLWREVEAKKFREDLYFRLAVFTIPLPSLRERQEDIPLLAQAFARSLPGGEQLLPRLTPDVLERLSNHPFPGNVRELRNVIERAKYLDADPSELVGPVVMPELVPGEQGRAVAPPPRTPAPVSSLTSAAPRPGGSQTLTEETAPVALADATVPLMADCSLPFKDAKEKLLEQFEAEYIKRILQRAGGNASAVARLAGIDRKHVYTLAKKHGLDLKARARDEDDERGR
jgi:DNA-binding NtrC family response regulator